MRRGKRQRETNNKFKYFIYLSGGMLIAIIVTFVITLIVYNNKLKEADYSALSTEEIADLIPNTEDYVSQINNQLETASSDIGKTIEEVTNNIEENKTQEVIEPNKSEEIVKEVKNETSENTKTEVEPEIIKDPEFTIPVEGEITKPYAKDSLIYSETLEEWIVHLGIDIKADRTTVVKAAEAGTVKAIKNDPRYGLTIVIEHTNGFKSIYSNLLTTEFVSEGESVEKGQSIGTVGNSAAFEIVDEPHLHFEILKDEINLDPTIYIK